MWLGCLLPQFHFTRSEKEIKSEKSTRCFENFLANRILLRLIAPAFELEANPSSVTFSLPVLADSRFGCICKCIFSMCDFSPTLCMYRFSQMSHAYGWVSAVFCRVTFAWGFVTVSTTISKATLLSCATVSGCESSGTLLIGNSASSPQVLVIIVDSNLWWIVSCFCKLDLCLYRFSQWAHACG